MTAMGRMGAPLSGATAEHRCNDNLRIFPFYSDAGAMHLLARDVTGIYLSYLSFRCLSGFGGFRRLLYSPSDKSKTSLLMFCLTMPHRHSSRLLRVQARLASPLPDRWPSMCNRVYPEGCYVPLLPLLRPMPSRAISCGAGESHHAGGLRLCETLRVFEYRRPAPALSHTANLSSEPLSKATGARLGPAAHAFTRALPRDD